MHVKPDGDHPLLRWMGGYFATRCAHHQSIARIYQRRHDRADQGRASGPPRLEAVHRPRRAVHQQLLRPQRPGGECDAAGHVAACRPNRPRREIVAWAVSRPDGGRGAGIVMPHFYKNWQVDDLRQLHHERHRLVGQARSARRRRQNAATRSRPIRTGRHRTATARGESEKDNNTKSYFAASTLINSNSSGLPGKINVIVESRLAIDRRERQAGKREFAEVDKQITSN